MLDLILWEFKTPKKMEKNWKCRKMESKWKVNSRGLLDTALMESNFDELDYNNSNDIANNSKGILRLYVYNTTEKSYRYEYYFIKVIKNKYFGNLCNHTFKMEVLQVLKGNHRQVGDIITKNGKILYHNYFEIRKANVFCRNCKHKQKYQKIMAMSV